MKTILSLSFVAFIGLANVAVSGDNDSAADVARNISTGKPPANSNGPANFKIDIQPLYSLGLLRTSPYIVGEALNFSARVTQAQPGKPADFDLAAMAELYDPDGNLLVQLPEMAYPRNSLQFGGSAFTQTFCFASRDVRPGKHRVKFLVVNHATGQTESADCEFEIADRETFAALGLTFSSTSDRYTPCGSAFTLGEPKFLMHWINGAGVQEGRIHVKSTLTVLDAKKQPTDAEPKTVDTYKPAPRGNNDHPMVYFLVFPNSRAGDFILHLEVKDCIADKTVSHDLPIKVLPPPGMDE